MKPATIDTGAEVKVPLFINTGDMIKVDIQKSIYVERGKVMRFYNTRYTTYWRWSPRTQRSMGLVH